MSDKTSKWIIIIVGILSYITAGVYAQTVSSLINDKVNQDGQSIQFIDLQINKLMAQEQALRKEQTTYNTELQEAQIIDNQTIQQNVINQPT